jgi:hypothetical protein
MRTPAHIDATARLRAPAQLSPAARQAFGEVVASVPPGHFMIGDLALLCEYARLVVYLGQLWDRLAAAGADDRYDLTAITVVQKNLFSVCRLLRLAPSGRVPNTPSRETQRRSAVHQRRAPASVYDTMEAANLEVTDAPQ